ncbi:MAG: hypothetical protein U0794_12070 [Isosphaeraceae bacterium]
MPKDELACHAAVPAAKVAETGCAGRDGRSTDPPTACSRRTPSPAMPVNVRVSTSRASLDADLICAAAALMNQETNVPALACSTAA